jgi:hypothetical protein
MMVIIEKVDGPSLNKTSKDKAEAEREKVYHEMKGSKRHRSHMISANSLSHFGMPNDIDS